MKTILHLITLIAISLSFNACTHNNGDIGDLFGTWKLQSITINDDLDSVYQSKNNIFWKYQASIISMLQVNDTTHSRIESWGTWKYVNDGKCIEYNFTHTDNNHPQIGSEYYSPLPDTHLPKGCIFILDILNISGDNMSLKYISDDGKQYIYKFKKWC